MKHALPALDSFKVFESAARHLSFSMAAEELCVSKGAVSYQIRRLEQSLDCALFRRSVRQVYLTDAGQRLFQATQRLFGELEETLQQIRPAEASHDVLVGATTYVAVRWLSPRIAKFTGTHPEISVLLQHAVNADDFRIQDVDFSIRWCALTGSTSRNRSLELPMPLFPVCSPRLLQREGLPTVPGTLATAAIAEAPLESIPLLCEDRSLDLWLAWYGEQDRPLENPRRTITDANVRTQAAIDGQGWTLADAMMQRELDSGVLVAPFEHALDGYGYALESAPGRYLNRAAAEFKQWLIENA